MSDLLPDDCDLSELRWHAEAFIKVASQPDESGAHYYMPKAAVEALHRFIAQPTADNARTLLTQVPSMQNLARRSVPGNDRLSPPVAIHLAIVRAASESYTELAPILGYDTSGTPARPQILMAWELLNLFVFLAMREARPVLTRPKWESLHEALVPMACAASVEWFCITWPQETQAGMRTDALHNLQNAEEDYARCTSFAVDGDLEAKESISGRLLSNLADAGSIKLNAQMRAAVLTAIVRAVEGMGLQAHLKVMAAMSDVEWTSLQEDLKEMAAMWHSLPVFQHKDLGAAQRIRLLPATARQVARRHLAERPTSVPRIIAVALAVIGAAAIYLWATAGADRR